MLVDVLLVDDINNNKDGDSVDEVFRFNSKFFVVAPLG
jgi:hypothetical protein